VSGGRMRMKEEQERRMFVCMEESEDGKEDGGV
jgi:hypothetical protein